MASGEVDMDDDDLALLLTLGSSDVEEKEEQTQPQKSVGAAGSGAGASEPPKTEGQQRKRKARDSGGFVSVAATKALSSKRKWAGESGGNYGGSVVERGQHAAEVLSQIRVKKPLVGSMVVTERTTCFPYMKLCKLGKASLDCFNGVWSTIAVVVEKSFPKESSSGNKFLVVKLGDLEGATFSLFLFGDAFAAHCTKVDFGCVVLITCAKAKKDDKAKGGDLSFSIAQEDQLLKIATSRDFGICKGTRRDGQPCTMPVNLQHSEYCKYHAGHALKKLKAAKMNIRPQMGGSNFYAHQQKVLHKHEMKRMDMMHRQRSKNAIKTMSGQQLMRFTNKYADSMPHSRGIGAIKAVASNANDFLPNANVNANATNQPPCVPFSASRMTPIPGGKRVPVPSRQNGNNSKQVPSANAHSSGGRMVDLTMGNHKALGVGAWSAKGKGNCNASKAPSASYAKALEFVKSLKGGKLQAPDPNRTSDIGVSSKGKEKEKGGGGGKSSTCSGQFDPDRRQDKPDFLVRKGEKKKEAQNKFLASFSNTRKSLEGQKAGETRSLYQSEAEEQDMRDANKRLHPLIKKDELTEQLASTTKIKVKCYFCKVCKQCHEWKPASCIKQGHSVTTIQATKRFWECARCKKRTTTIGLAYPKVRCTKCKCSEFNKVAMGKAPKIALTSIGNREQLKVRGTEHAKFLKSTT